MKKKISVLLLIAMLFSMISLSACSKEATIETFFLASDEPCVAVYTLNEDKLESQEPQLRGLEVIKSGKTFSKDEVNYVSFKLENSEDVPEYYVAEENTADKYEACVKETQKFVRTSTTLYANAEDPSIAGFIKKGTPLEITGFDFISWDGNVNMYQVSANEQSGYVYPKYLANTQEEANAINTDYYELNKDAYYSYDLLGGTPENLDYFPFDKNLYITKEIPLDARTYYLNGGCVTKTQSGEYVIDNYIELAKSCGCNAMVVDIKDGYMVYKSDVSKIYCPTAYENASMTKAEYKESIDRLKEAGIWTIGRIVVFKDSHFAADHPDVCITSNGENLGWPSAFTRLTWEYNVKLAQEAATDIGFDEIQLDYVRFPENAYGLSSDSSTDFKNAFNEDKAETVQNFCMYASDNIHKAGAFFSVDVFGECSNGYITAYGQYWPAISNVVDVISSMPYVDHYGRGEDTWSNQYQTVYNWGCQASSAQEKTPNPAITRTWISCYDLPMWDPYIIMDDTVLGNEIQGLWDAGVGYGGFMTWNGQSNLDIYYRVAPAFLRSYS